jgi:hypothetical protein
MDQGVISLKKGQFYEIYEANDSDFVLEDKTKRGLEVREHSFDDKYGVESEKGMIYDIDGVGHQIGIRWYFPKAKYSLQRVSEIAEALEAKYKAIREMTCPDDL